MIGSLLDSKGRADLSQQMRSRYARLSQSASLARRDSANPDYAGELDGVHDLEEQAMTDVQEDLRLSDAARDEAEMQDIEMALARMHEGSYGVCADCGEVVEFERLRAYPTAKRCRPCQERYERARGVGATPRL